MYDLGSGCLWEEYGHQKASKKRMRCFLGRNSAFCETKMI